MLPRSCSTFHRVTICHFQFTSCGKSRILSRDDFMDSTIFHQDSWRWWINPYAPWCWYIYLQNWVIYGVNVGKYSSTMEHMGKKRRTIGWCEPTKTWTSLLQPRKSDRLQNQNISFTHLPWKKCWYTLNSWAFGTCEIHWPETMGKSIDLAKNNGKTA